MRVILASSWAHQTLVAAAGAGLLVTSRQLEAEVGYLVFQQLIISSKTFFTSGVDHGDVENHSP